MDHPNPDQPETKNSKQQILNNKFQITISKSQKGQNPTIDCHVDFSNIDDWNILSSGP